MRPACAFSARTQRIAKSSLRRLTAARARPVTQNYCECFKNNCLRRSLQPHGRNNCDTSDADEAHATDFYRDAAEAVEEDEARAFAEHQHGDRRCLASAEAGEDRVCDDLSNA